MLSKTQIDKLGDRLRKGETSAADEEAFGEMLADYDEALQRSSSG